MIVNGVLLANMEPLSPLIGGKQRSHGVSYGLSEAGYDLRIAQTVILHPFRRFSLASTVEWFHMPDNLVAVVHDKSTWARRGLSVFNTVIEPGWVGETLTLELVYHGWKPLRIPRGAGIAQVLFHEIAARAEYDGKYQNAGPDPQPAIYEAPQ